jgi:LPS-assembly protein
VCALPYASAQDVCLPVYDPAADLPPGPSASEIDDLLDIEAGSVRLGGDSTAEFTDQVQIRYRNSVISAERATYNRDDDLVEVIGSVTFRGPDVLVYSEDAEFDRDNDRVEFAAAGFDLPKRPARGSAERIVIDSNRMLSLSNVLFTTCPADNVAWELQASDIVLDVNEGLGRARGVRLEFKGVPILYAPYFTFPIDDQRKSGFLTPEFGERDRTGLDISAPYYLNLRPNLDMTLVPRYMSDRGLQLNTEFRYLLPTSEGQIDVEYLPDDDEIGDLRRYVNLQHETAFTSWLVQAGFQEVSDPAYFEDLGNSLSVTSQTHLNRFIDVNFFAPYWSILTRFQNYQTIDSFIEAGDQPYERVPQMLFTGRWFDRRFAFDSTTELANFDRDVGVTGWRLDSTQEISLRFARSGMYLMPAIAWRQTNYWIDDPVPGEDDTLDRGLPIASLDSGLRFERTAGRDAGWIQTLEPRMLYVNVPFEDQSALPVFDTITPDFNLVQLFRKYQYVGPDRVADADQLSFGLTTRLIDSASGQERVTATLGQTRYLTSRSVTLPGESRTDTSASDYLAELSINLNDIWNLDVGYQWNGETDSSVRTETRFEYRPQPDRLFGLGYRYRRELLEQGDFSLVWPVSEHWRLIGRYSYSFLEKEPLEQYLGWEYEACCWRLRMVGRRYVSRRTGESDSAIAIQLELKGLSQRATSPEQLLDRGILGYRRIATTSAQ